MQISRTTRVIVVSILIIALALTAVGSIFGQDNNKATDEYQIYN